LHKEVSLIRSLTYVRFGGIGSVADMHTYNGQTRGLKRGIRRAKTEPRK